MLPPPDEVLIHTPTWVRGRGTSYHGTEPVSLVMAMEGEPSSHHGAMIASHLEVLLGWVEIAEDVLATRPLDAPERRGVGFALLVFAAELSSALYSERFGPHVDPEVRVLATEAIAQATLRAAALLAAMVCDYQASVA